jgi:hypothetical protein
MMPAALRGLMYFCELGLDPTPLVLFCDEIVGRRTPPRDAIGSDWSESLWIYKKQNLFKTSYKQKSFKLTAWFNIPTETLRIPMPEVDDFPTDDALRFGRFLEVFRSFGDFEAEDGLLLNPMEITFKLV